jgi:hypothetical protein
MLPAPMGGLRPTPQQTAASLCAGLEHVNPPWRDWTDEGLKGLQDLANSSPSIHGHKDQACAAAMGVLASLDAATVRPLSIDMVSADLGMTQVRWSAREGAAQSTLKWAALYPEINLHREPGVLDCVVQVAGTCELDSLADHTQSGAAAELERPVPFHGAVQGPIQRGQS